MDIYQFFFLFETEPHCVALTDFKWIFCYPRALRTGKHCLPLFFGEETALLQGDVDCLGAGGMGLGRPKKDRPPHWGGGAALEFWFSLEGS